MSIHLLGPAFVDAIPEHLKTGTIYVSLPYATAVHLCPCGCGIEVVTPISPKDWRLEWNGEDISLYPSVGNARFPCGSHYHVRRGCIDWLSETAGTDTVVTPRRTLGVFLSNLVRSLVKQFTTYKGKTAISDDGKADRR
jgi:hypothetical protein